jgi:integrase
MTRTQSTERRCRFTHALLESLPAHEAHSPSREMEYSDTEIAGLRLLVSKSGRRFFYLRYRHRGRKRALRIGEFPSVSLKDARQRCHEAKGQLARSEDPAAQREAKRAIPTLAEFSATYLDWARKNKRSWGDDEYRINLELIPRFGRLPLDAIAPRDIQAMHQQIQARTSNSTANRYLGLVSRMYSLANELEVYAENPARKVRKAAENPARERFLGREELGKFLAALEELPGRPAADALAFLALTGLRKNEALLLEWSRVRREEGTVFLAQTKNGKPRTVLLNDAARAVLERRWAEREGEHPYVFPGRLAGKPVNNPQKAFDLACAKAGIAGACIHTLRHSFASLALSVGATLYDVSKLLGHSNTQTTARYSHHEGAALLKISQQAAGQIGRASGEQGKDGDSAADCGGNVDAA